MSNQGSDSGNWQNLAPELPANLIVYQMVKQAKFGPDLCSAGTVCPCLMVGYESGSQKELVVKGKLRVTIAYICQQLVLDDTMLAYMCAEFMYLAEEYKKLNMKT